MRRDSLLFHHDFRKLWASDTVSQFGTFVGQTVLPILAATALAATPFQMGLLTAAETAAFLLIGLPAGVWVDRLRRRKLMLRADFARAALLLTVPIAWWAGWLTLTQLIVVALVVGACTVFFDIAYQSYLPSLISRERLVEGNSKLQATQSVAQVAGPGLGGPANAAGQRGQRGPHHRERLSDLRVVPLAHQSRRAGTATATARESPTVATDHGGPAHRVRELHPAQR